MVKVEVNTPNKRKSIGANTSAKKIKIENGNGKSPSKAFSPKKEPQSPKGKQQFSKINKQIKVEASDDLPKQAPKGNQQMNKKNKQIKAEAIDGAAKTVSLPPKGNKPSKKNQQVKDGSPKTIKPFAGTKQVKAGKQTQKPKDGDQATESKKKRKNAYANLIAQVKANEGSKNPELIKNLDDRIAAINSRDEITKTAKKKLSILSKLKLICLEGSSAASEKTKLKIAEAKKVAVQKKLEKQTQAVKKEGAGKKAAGKTPAAVKAEEDDDDEEADDSDEDSDAEKAEEDDDDEEADDSDEDSDAEEVEGEDSSDEEEAIPVPSHKGKVQPSISKLENKPSSKQPTMGDLYNKDIVKKGQKRFVLFVGNIPFDATKQELSEHFSKVGDIVDIRIPTEKGSNRPRGFAYVEVNNDTSYEKCLSMHHSQLRGRRINVLYTQGGKKKGDDKKKEIKVKNFKLHALRKQGKLAGSVKETQKRTFRRNKNKGQPENEQS